VKTRVETTHRAAYDLGDDDLERLFDGPPR